MVSLSNGDVMRQVWMMMGTDKRQTITTIGQTLSKRQGLESIRYVSLPSKLKMGNHCSPSISFERLRYKIASALSTHINRSMQLNEATYYSICLIAMAM